MKVRRIELELELNEIDALVGYLRSQHNGKGIDLLGDVWRLIRIDWPSSSDKVVVTFEAS
jgi:hypothetical protein